MNDNKRRAIVWHMIERLAFRPDSPQKWLGVYARTIQPLWGIPRTGDHLSLDDKFEVPFLNLRCDYFIDSVAKYTVSLVHHSPARLNWKTHIDPEYHSKSSLQAPVDKYPRQQMKNKLRRDVAVVLDGMIFHPRCHVHLQDFGIELDLDRDGLSSHEARIGGGIENPYVFLFHLRYQLCLVSEQIRQSERQRLINLFVRAIGTKDKTVNARDLFNFRIGN